MQYARLTMRHIGAFLSATKQDEMEVLLNLCQFDYATPFVLRALLVRGAGYQDSSCPAQNAVNHDFVSCVN